MNLVLYYIIICCCIFFLVQAHQRRRRLVGGKEVKEYDRWMSAFTVSIWDRYADEDPPKEIYFCTGSIISTRYVITAAHCMKNFRGNPADIYIKAGSLHLQSPDLTPYSISTITIHENFQGGVNQNDIALLQTTNPILFGDHVRPISLVDNPPPDGSPVTIMGWGVTDLTRNLVSETLMKITGVVYPMQECKLVDGGYGEVYGRLSGDYICTVSRNGTGACMGDSGGPVVYNEKLAGLISGGVPCGEGFPDVQVNVAEYVSWVLSKSLILSET